MIIWESSRFDTPWYCDTSVTPKVFQFIVPSNDGRRHGRGTNLYFLRRSAILYADRRNICYWCLLQRLQRLQDAGTPSNRTRHTCHLGGHPSKYYPGPTLLDFGDQMGTAMSNVARQGLWLWNWCKLAWKRVPSPGVQESAYLSTLKNYIYKGSLNYQYEF
jgi:hypothetical protein